MKNLFHIGLLAACLFGPMAPALADSPQEAATGFVQQRHLGSNLKTLALAVAQRTQTFAMLASELGTEEAKSLVSDELDAQAHQYAPQWNANLAQVYAHHFSAEELRSLTVDGRNSRYAAKLEEKQNAIGADMQRLSTPILTAYVSAAMHTVFSRSGKR